MISICGWMQCSGHEPRGLDQVGDSLEGRLTEPELALASLAQVRASCCFLSFQAVYHLTTASWFCQLTACSHSCIALARPRPQAVLFATCPPGIEIYLLPPSITRGRSFNAHSHTQSTATSADYNMLICPLTAMCCRLEMLCIGWLKQCQQLIVASAALRI